MTSGKLWPVSTCSTGNGTLPGQKALVARCSITTESLPPEEQQRGRLKLGHHLADDVDGLGLEAASRDERRGTTGRAPRLRPAWSSVSQDCSAHT